jgi:hypothetical protein
MAKVRMAPTTNKNRLKPIPTWYLLDDAQVRSRARHRQTATTLKEPRQDGDRYRHHHKPDKRRRFASPAARCPCWPAAIATGGAQPPEHTEVGAEAPPGTPQPAASPTPGYAC